MPFFDLWAFGSSAETVALVNVGGIANVTLLLPNGRVLGWDRCECRDSLRVLVDVRG